MSTTYVPCPRCEKINRTQIGRADAEEAVCGACKNPLPIEHGVVQVNGTALQHLLDRSNALQISVLVDFWSTWCAPCRAFEPEFQKTAIQLASRNVVCAKLNVEQYSLAAGMYGIRTLPTLILFQGGVEVSRQFGALPASALISWFDSLSKRAA